MLTQAGLPDRAGLPRIAHVRNPWDWYVSLYFFMEQHYVNRTGGFSVPRDRWSAGCDHWERFYSKGNDIAGFQAGLPVLLHKMFDEGNEAVALPQHTFLRSPDGFLGVDHLVAFENLRENILEAIRATGAAVPPAFRQAVLQRKKENTSSHGPYQRFYTPALRDEVAERERWVIDQVGYEY